MEKRLKELIKTDSLSFVFPGQGSQYVGMGKDLFENFRIARDTFEEADESLKFFISRLCFEGPEDKLQLTENAQPAILTVSIAFIRILESETDIKPLFLAGHSLGEYTALVVSGALRFTDAVRIVKQRGKFMQEAVPVGEGKMAAILGLDKDIVEAVCKEAAQDEVLEPANFNCPGQIVIGGHSQAVERAVKLSMEKGARNAVLLSVSAPFHTSLMESAAEKLAQVLDPIGVNDFSYPVLSNVKGDFYSSINEVKPLLIRQVNSPVLWELCVRRMIEKGCKNFIEIGPGRVLSGLIKRIDRNVFVTPVNSLETLKEIIIT